MDLAKTFGFGGGFISVIPLPKRDVKIEDGRHVRAFFVFGFLGLSRIPVYLVIMDVVVVVLDSAVIGI